MRRGTIAALGFGIVLTATAFAATLPAYFKLPSRATAVADSITEEAYGEADFPTGDDLNVKRGRHFHADLRLEGVTEAQGHEGLWGPFRTALTAGGWTVQKYFDVNPPSATLRYLQGGVEAWASIVMFAGDDIRMELVEVRPFAPTLTLKAPAAARETVAATDSFPYLTPIGGTLRGTDDDGAALWVKFKGDDEPTLVATGSVRKDYSVAEGVSNVQFVIEYRQALTKAGWEIVEESQGLHQSDAVLIAHYVRNSRDIWTSLHFGGELSIAVADVGGDLAATLARDCRVPLYGITFDFNKATLRPEADSTLQRVADTLQANAALNVEVQGHTDNVGSDAYNQALSQSRADAVRTWLTAHGIGAARVTSKGYGLTQPIADNGTDEGRAKNRRVVLARPGC